MSESEIIVKPDGLYKDGVKLRLEFGNLEQIAAIRKFERRMKQYNDGFTPIINYEVKATALLECVCGRTLKVETDADHDGDIGCFDTLEKQCYCNKKYKFVLNKEWFRINGRLALKNEDIIVKLTN